ncbi:unnamed protein product, partial [Scytosiphon promiscuus]
VVDARALLTNFLIHPVSFVLPETGGSSVTQKFFVRSDRGFRSLRWLQRHVNRIIHHRPQWLAKQPTQPLQLKKRQPPPQHYWHCLHRSYFRWTTLSVGLGKKR